MKMKQEDFDYLRNCIFEELKKEGINMETAKKKYEQVNLSMKRFRWDLLRFAKIRPGSVWAPTDWNVYDYLNDDHIDTALRKITNTK